MRVSELTRQKPVNVTVDLGDGDTVTLAFDRNRVTPAWVTLAAARDDENDTLSLPKALADVILSWDVIVDESTPFAVTAENIAVLSFPVQKKLLEDILTFAVPSRAEGNDLSGPPVTPSSGSEVPAPISLNGAATVPSPAVSESASPL